VMKKFILYEWNFSNENFIRILLRPI
jgi:hypothetical protein